MPDQPVLIFDGACGFCRIWVEHWKQLTPNISYAQSQDVATRYPQLDPSAFHHAVQLVQPGGNVLSGAHAVFEALSHAPSHRWMLWSYLHLPGFAPASELFYRLVASHWNAAYWLTRLSFGSRIEPVLFHKVVWLFARFLGFIYLTAFLSCGLQIVGLIGARGVLPLARYLPAVHQALGASAYWNLPSLFWLNSSDLALQAVCVAGALASLGIMFGYAQRILFCFTFVLYLSICSGGQDFFSFQWDMLLLECGFLAIFLAPTRTIVWLYRLLLFRLMFLSGAVKLLSHDPAWRSLDALRYHYWTQPLPTPLAWYASQLPVWFQRFSTCGVFIIEIGLPFLIFFPRRLRLIAAAGFFFLQVLILLTGNYTFFNLLAIALCLFLLDDSLLPGQTAAPIRVQRLSPAVPLLLIPLGLFQILNTIAPQPGLIEPILRFTSPFGIVNSYGLFAVMTTSRPEIIVQGSDDGLNWLDYEFKYKPGSDLSRGLGWVAPYQPRLDWQMWFASLSDWHSNPWFVSFLARLLQASPEVLKLLDKNPFPSHPPRFVRALVYEYRFTDSETYQKTGAWWKRDMKGTYLQPISLSDLTNP